MYPVTLLIFSCLLFSVLAALIKFLSSAVPAVEQAFFRNILSIFLLLPFVIKQKKFFKKQSNKFLIFLRGIFGGITMILIFLSYTMIPLSQAMAISFTTPLFIYFGSVIFLGEKNNREKTFFMIIGFFFTLIIIRPDLEFQIGTLLALLSALTHAIAGLLVKKLSETEDIITLMFSMVVLMTPITFLPAVFVWETPSNFSEIFILILIAIIATLGNFFWTRAISLSKLTNLMPFDFSKLIFATFLGFIFFNEQIDSITIICGIGIVFCNSMLFKRLNFEKK